MLQDIMNECIYFRLDKSYKSLTLKQLDKFFKMQFCFLIVFPITVILLCETGSIQWHYGNQSWGYLIGGRPLWPPAVPRLAARSSQSSPRGSGPEVLKRERGHVTAETGVAEVGVFRALKPNGYLASTMLKHQAISSYTAEYAPMYFQLFMGQNQFQIWNCKFIHAMFISIAELHVNEVYMYASWISN